MFTKLKFKLEMFAAVCLSYVKRCISISIVKNIPLVENCGKDLDYSRTV